MMVNYNKEKVKKANYVLVSSKNDKKNELELDKIISLITKR